MSPNRPAVVLAVVGLLCLPGPAYVFALDNLTEPDRYRVSAGYVADPIDAESDALLADRYAVHLTFQPEDMQYRHVSDEYRRPNETRDALERAIQEGQATVTDPDVARDLRRLERNHTYLSPEYDRYYDYRLVETDDGARLEAERASDDEIAATVRERLVVEYGELTPAERETFRKIRNATVNDDDYRPWSDEPVPEEPIVERDGTYYAVEVYSHTDDFDFPDGVVFGVVASFLGVVCLLGSGGIAAYGWWRERGDE